MIPTQDFDFADVLVTLPLQEVDLLQEFLLVVLQLAHGLDWLGRGGWVWDVCLPLRTLLVDSGEVFLGCLLAFGPVCVCVCVFGYDNDSELVL